MKLFDEVPKVTSLEDDHYVGAAKTGDGLVAITKSDLFKEMVTKSDLIGGDITGGDSSGIQTSVIVVDAIAPPVSTGGIDANYLSNSWQIGNSATKKTYANTNIIVTLRGTGQRFSLLSNGLTVLLDNSGSTPSDSGIINMSNGLSTGLMSVEYFGKRFPLPIRSSAVYYDSGVSNWVLQQNQGGTTDIGTEFSTINGFILYERTTRTFYKCNADGTSEKTGSIVESITTVQLDSYISNGGKTGYYSVDSQYMAIHMENSTTGATQIKFDVDGSIYYRTVDVQDWTPISGGGGGGTGADGTSTIFIKRTDNAASVNIYKTEAELVQLARAGFTEWDLVLSGSGYTVKVGDIIGIPYKNSTYNNKTDYVVGVVNHLDSATSATLLGFGRVNSGIDGKDGAINGVHYFETFAAASTAVNGSSFYEGKSILIAQDDWNLRIGDTDGVFRDMESFGASHTSIPANDFTPSVYNLFAAIINGYGR